MRRVTGVCALTLAMLPAAATAQFTDWSVPVNLGPTVNSRYVESCVTISKNGLSLFFSSNRQSPGTSNRDLYVSKRGSVTEPWGLPQPLLSLNTTAWESCPALSLDEHRLFFTSPRPGGCGNQDIWVSRRHDRRDDFGWEPPVNLGCAPAGPNSVGGDLTPALFEDEAGRVLMYFSSDLDGFGEYHILESVMGEGGTFAPASQVTELMGPFEQGVTVRRDGLEVIFLSYRPESGGSYDWPDFWAASRTSTAHPWSAPVLVPSLGSPSLAQGKISLSFDGRELYFTSSRPLGFGSADLWVARRDKLQGEKK